jgi:hypothetical protein
VIWLPWISLFFSLATPFVIFVGRNWLKARIEKGVQHHFDRGIETVRAEFRESEERLKSDLRNRETEIASLRNNVLTGNASRQAMLDKRRFEAVERIWTAVNDLARLKHISGMIAIMDVDEVAKDIRDPRMKGVLAMIGVAAPDMKELKNDARNEQPFVPELAWAYFRAYTSILYSNLVTYKILETGVDDPMKYLKKDGNKEILKAALPHQSQWIDQTEPQMYHFLLEELEGNLLAELRKILEGADVSKAEIERAKQILDAVTLADKKNIETAEVREARGR